MTLVTLNLPDTLRDELAATLVELTGLSESDAETAVDAVASRLVEEIAEYRIVVRRIGVGESVAYERGETVPPDIVERARELAVNNLWIPAIKLVREHSTLGLREAKEFVEGLAAESRGDGAPNA